MNYQRNNLPSVPWWVIILGFLFFAPAGVVLLIYKLIQDSQPKNTGWYTQQTQQAQQAQQSGQAAQSARPQTSRTRHTGKIYTPKRKFPYVRLKSGKAQTVLGALFAVIFGFAAVTTVLDWLPNYPWYALQDAMSPGLMACVGLGLFVWGRFRANQTKKFKRYLARIGNDPLIPLRPLAESIPADMDEVCETLQDMIDYGVFGDRAYIDFASETLVVDSTVARPKPAAKPAKAEPPKPAEDKTLTPEDKILQEIRRANDLIPDEVISAKIDRIEEITRHILTYLNKHPERSSELHTFLDYYLPTTLKMLHTYAELDAQQLEGQNVSATKTRIEGILDKVVEGFELQLDKLFEGDMLDISADIDVMERMLQRDGLSNDLKMPKADAGDAPYSPRLTLDPDAPGGTAAAGH
ncbi:MAG TPA: 5-bromo-4-chloroindolyl phosphate hydrolysis family protein [Candidatus Onthomonas avicola]|nr:5-bromo-4-chloroindolyl phosphate hydrolysis family protein [Candidatus Onthomonas avicola]